MTSRMPTLQIINRQGVDVGDVPVDDVAALVHTFTATGDRTKESIVRAQAYLAFLHQRRQWLRCGCGAEEPRLGPVRNRSGYTIRKFSGGAHPEHCSFFRAIVDPGDDDERSIEKSSKADAPARRPFQGEVLLLKRTSTKKREPRAHDEDHRDRHASDRPPQVGLLLWTWMERTGYGTLSANDLKPGKDGHAQHSRISEHYQAIEAIREAPIPRSQLKLGDILETHYLRLRALKNFLMEHAGAFPAKYLPQGYYVGVVHQLERNGTRCDLTWTDKEGKSYRETVYGEAPSLTDGAHGPYYVIAQMAKDALTHKPVLIKAFAQPIVSRALILPVDSDFERQVARMLTEQMLYWRDKYNISVMLEKPLMDLEGRDDEWSRPDFILRLPSGAALVVEAAGRSDPEYVERKKRTQARMAALPGVVEVLEYGTDTDFASLEVRKELTKKVLKFQNTSSARGS